MSDRTPEASTAADHRTPRVRWPATTGTGFAASAPTAQDRPRRTAVFRRAGFFAVGFFFATGFLATGFLPCVLALTLRLTLTLRLAFFLTLLPRTETFGAGAGAGTAAGTETDESPPGPEFEPPPACGIWYSGPIL